MEVEELLSQRSSAGSGWSGRTTQGLAHGEGVGGSLRLKTHEEWDFSGTPVSWWQWYVVGHLGVFYMLPLEMVDGRFACEKERGRSNLVPARRSFLSACGSEMSREGCMYVWRGVSRRTYLQFIALLWSSQAMLCLSSEFFINGSIDAVLMHYPLIKR